MKNTISFILLMLAVAIPASAQENTSYKVSYVSAENVYLGAGTMDGLMVGDRLGKVVDGKKEAILEIVYVSQHSSSCRLLEGAEPPKVDDRLILVHAAPREEVKTKTAEPPQPKSSLSPTSLPAGPNPIPTRLYGNVMMTMYQWWDGSEANLDFTQTSARLNLRAENVLMKDMTFAVRSRGRYDVRNRAYSTGSAETEWKNRLWVLSLEYESSDFPLAMSVGRFLPRQLGNTGYLDGLMMSARIGNHLSTGMLGGRRPDFGLSQPQMEITKYAGYVAYKSDRSSAVRFDQTLGTAAEYHGATPNREYIFMRGSVTNGSQMGFNQLVEVDVNSGWRKEVAGRALSISTLYLHSWWRVNRSVRLTLQYDNRQNYWTYEYRPVADSLFDDRVRQGIRGRVDLSVIRHLWTSASMGYRKTGDVDPTTNYTGSIRRTGFFGYPASLMLSYFGFNSALENGGRYSLRSQLPPSRLGSLYFATGGYTYSVKGQNYTRHSRSYEIGTNFDFAQGYYIGGSSEWSSGDDIDGVRVLLQLGYRY